MKKLEILGKRIGDAQAEYEALTTTRRRQLERPLNKIEELRTQRGLPVSPDEGEESPLVIEVQDRENENKT